MERMAMAEAEGCAALRFAAFSQEEYTRRSPFKVDFHEENDLCGVVVL